MEESLWTGELVGSIRSPEQERGRERERERVFKVMVWEGFFGGMGFTKSVRGTSGERERGHCNAWGLYQLLHAHLK